MAMLRRMGNAYQPALRWAALLFVLNFTCFALMFFPADAAIRSLASDIGGIVIPAISCVCCFRMGRANKSRRLSQIRFLPTVLGLCSLIYAIGSILYAYDTRILGRPGNPGWCDLFFLLQYPAFIAAIALWPARPLPSAMRWRTWSDALVLVAALFSFGWVYLIGPAVVDSDMSSLGILIDTAYPLFDILIIFSLLQMMRKHLDARFRLPTYIFAAAITINVLGDLYYALSQIGGEYHSGVWYDIAWPLTCSLAAFAGLLVRIRMEVPGFREAKSDVRILVTQRTWTLYAPYVMVPAVGMLIIHVGTGNGPTLIRTGVYFCGLALAIAILIRQLIVIAENGCLYSSLREAFAELEQKSHQISLTAEQSALMNERLRQMTEELEGRNKHLSETNEHLELIATRDSMTGLANHRSFQERLKQEVARAARHGHCLALALIDVDFFKQYNDSYGHPAGDEVLRSIGKMLQECTRAGDLAARYGGEEFAMLLPFVNAEEAENILERLRFGVSTFAFKHRRVTLSIGFTMLSMENASPEQILEQADKALYTAKGRGRNQVVRYGDLQLAASSPEEQGLGFKFDLHAPLGYGAILSAGMRYHPQALSLEPHAALVAGLLATLELKDPMTRGSSTRVMWFALRLAQSCREQNVVDLSAPQIRSLGLGALLHDLGRMGISDSTLKSPGAMSPEMLEEIQQHPAIGAELIQKFPGLNIAIPTILHHHERWDGEGYPHGLSGETIPLEARILAFADAFNAMSMDRPYAMKKSYAEICDEFEIHAGGQFDPKILPAFLAVPEMEWDRLRALDAYDFGNRTRAA